jgi:hypothetical protein
MATVEIPGLRARYDDSVAEGRDARNIFAALPDLNGCVDRQLKSFIQRILPEDDVLPAAYCALQDVVFKDLPQMTKGILPFQRADFLKV